MGAKDPRSFAEKWRRRLKGATEDYRAGVSAVSTPPGELAAAKKDKWLKKVQDSADKWAENVRSVPLEEWKKQAIEKGAARLSSGADAAVTKVEKFATDLLAHINAGLPTLKSMPDMTLEDSIARVEYWIRHMAKFRKKGR